MLKVLKLVGQAILYSTAFHRIGLTLTVLIIGYITYHEIELGPKVTIAVPCYQQIGPDRYVKIYKLRNLHLKKELFTTELDAAMQDTSFLSQ